MGGGERPRTLREHLAATHPPALTRVAKIEALRHVQAGGQFGGQFGGQEFRR
jgi:hypothetical protein